MTPTLDFLTPVRFGALELQNRVVLAPLTRLRNTPEGVPTTLADTYYSQRASAGLMVTEATAVSQQGVGYPGAPGIWNEAQIAAWRRVVEAVHAKGGKLALQLWHVGRISHPSHQPDGALPVAPSAIAARGQVTTAQWRQEPFPTPRALAASELPGIVAQFAQGARNALAAGFDAVEIHGANGYLLDQFLQNGTNQRTDAYGGSVAHRARLLLEVADAVIGVWGPGRVGVRLSPYGNFNDMSDSDPKALFSHVISELDKRALAYLHLIEPRDDADKPSGMPSSRELFRPLFRGALLSAGGYNRRDALAALRSGAVDAIAFGRWFISNPDLPEKLARDLPLTPYDRSTFYGGGAKGYTDYPSKVAVPATA